MNNQFDIILEKIKNYCVYRERSHQEVEIKLTSLKAYPDWKSEIICTLISEGYLNELRFAKAYVSGKFRIKNWGKNKIRQHLLLKKVSEYCIEKALESEIDEESYMDTLIMLLSKKLIYMKQENIYLTKQKLLKYAFGKGYEYEIINKAISTLNLSYIEKNNH